MDTCGSSCNYIRMSSAKTITLKDVAIESGVSVMTVSRVLRNHPNISKATREKVRKVADDLGYRPNPLVAALMSYRRSAKPTKDFSTLGFITAFPVRGGWRDTPLYRDFFEGASKSASRHGFNLEEFWLREPGMTAERLSSIMYHRNVPGLIIASLPVSQGHLRLEWENFSAVTFGYSLARPILHKAGNHQFRSMRLAMRHLRKLGYTRMGFAMARSYDRRVDHNWSGSFLIEQAGIERDQRVPLFLAEDEEWTEANFANWFCHHRPDVILSQQAEILEWLKKLGCRVPEDVGFAHMNCPDTSGAFAGIYQNGQVVGEVAMDFLVSMVQRNERGVPKLAHTILVEGTWVDGQTIRRQTRA
jgi:LacI family transcriptional regulator